MFEKTSTMTSSKYLNGLSKEQSSAAQSQTGTNAIVATAGAGKTTTMSAAICLLMEQGVPDNEILATTFTNAAAKELKERVEKKYGRSVSIKSGTIHSYAMELLIKYYKILGYKTEPTIIDERTADSLKVEIALQITGLSDFKKISTFTMEDIKKEIADQDIRQQKNAEVRDFDQSLLNRPPVKAVRDIAKLYSQRLKKYACIDFDKILVEALRLVETINEQNINIKLPKYVFIDEAQDLSAIQWLLVYQLSKRAVSTTVIGDDDQSIYLWRGAKPWRFIDFVNKANNKFFLSANRRCGEKIVDLAASIVSVIPETRRVKKDLSSAREGFLGKIRLSAIPTLDSLNLIAEKIKREVSESNNTLKYSDYAIIVRSTSLLFPKMEGFLSSAGVPYEILGGKSSYESGEGRMLKKIMALSCVDDDFLSRLNENNLALVEVRGDIRLHFSEILNLCGVSQSSIESLISKVEHLNNNDTLSITEFLRFFIKVIEEKSRVAPETKGFIKEVFDIIIDICDKGGPKCPVKYIFNNDVILALINKTIERNTRELVDELRKRDPKAFDQETYKRKYSEIKNAKTQMLLSLFYIPYQNDLLKYALSAIELSREDQEEGDANSHGKLTLTTCHSSKGLEWKKVYVLEVNSNNWPSSMANKTIERGALGRGIAEDIMDEERRLLYVAITRAKDEVCLVSSAVDMRTYNMNEPSYFLNQEVRQVFMNIIEYVRENRKSKGIDI